jgi:predicted RNase H-like nuclease
LRFVGIDLAWSEKHPSAVAIINSDGTLQKADAKLKGNEQICDFADLAKGVDAVIAIDAPLIVKNLTGQRPVEVLLTSIFGPYDAGPHSANLSNTNFQETGRIQRVVKMLETFGFSQQPQVSRPQPQKTFFEVFPAPALVILFPCQLHATHTHCRPPRYKHKSRRSWPELCSEWEIYRARLRSLECREPALKFSPDVKRLLGADITDYRGATYKYFDDLLDGILCAYLGYYFWYWGEEGSWILGDSESGYIVLPKCPLKGCPIPIGR